jgi:prepilin-type N-terminal cleavage/methylation domain-containing protein
MFSISRIITAPVKRTRITASQRNLQGFTLIELLVVISIISVIAAILFPVFAQARERARMASCLSNGKQIGLASMMYAQDYDDTLPETGFNMPCHNPADPAKANNDAYWSGVYAWPIAIYPYTKNYQMLSCPSDSNRSGFNKDSQCYEDQLLAANVPGAHPGMHSEPFGERDVLPLSYAGNYMLSGSYSIPATATSAAETGVSGSKMRPMAAFAAPSQLVYVFDVGSNAAGRGTWYSTVGYGASASLNGQWPSGGRHFGGRIIVFCDGHAKWYKDPPYVVNGHTLSQTEIIADYQQRGVFTYPNTDLN